MTVDLARPQRRGLLDATQMFFDGDALGLLALSPTDVQAQGTMNTLSGIIPKGISGNIVLGLYNNQAALYNDVSQTTTFLNVPNDSTAYGMSGNYIVGSYLDNNDNSHGFLYNISTGTYVTLDDPLAYLSATPLIGNSVSGTKLIGIYGNNIIGNYVDTSDVEHSLLYNITNQTWMTLTYPGLGDVEANGIYGSDIVGNVTNPSTGLPEGFIYNGSTWSTFLFLEAILPYRVGFLAMKL
jgi:hypothetical protein